MKIKWLLFLDPWLSALNDWRHINDFSLHTRLSATLLVAAAAAGICIGHHHFPAIFSLQLQRSVSYH